MTSILCYDVTLISQTLVSSDESNAETAAPAVPKVEFILF